MTRYFWTSKFIIILLALLISACGAAARQVVPTARPTSTLTLTPTITRTPGFGTTPTPTPQTVAGGPTVTPLFGPTSTAAIVAATSTRAPNPNAPRIEFFTTSIQQAAPGDQVSLFWSVRNARNAIIYRLDAAGVRGNLWNVPPDGNLTVSISRRDRGQATFLLSAGEGDLETTQLLSIPLSCPDPWFFQPAPDSCPAGPAEATTIIEEPFERGRMIYVQTRNRVYVLFNDGRTPAWLSFENRYNPAVDKESEESFVPPPNLFQPVRALGFVWRGNDVVRNRLGLGTAAETQYEGFVQVVQNGEQEDLYINSADGSILQLVPGGDLWQIITLSSS
ncbi:MAG: hypothetical protein LCI00_33635 [Chloroflexi bacterium]|nr:hypothetical protein [Chloroflexota bacterium]MCC6894034.1 hypothetical protein [Anaerolineae bacterium]